MLLITFVVVFIIDNPGVIDSIKKWIWKRYIKIGDYNNINLKPFDCSLCSTWWINLIYIAITGKFSILYIAFSALLSLLASNIADFQRWIKDLLTTIINLLYKLLGQ